ncbi:hypothetical protein QJS10_CPA02g00853 [Acorus calamus]|uniref:Uncharacterized protein n=1 Tax=Acorus calamus TaxID=4465 RepID=A0AAV9FCV2_ACOCL|nr:hypothetical protein QJS10_CPA02g00853 [Acorus calamus]
MDLCLLNPKSGVVGVCVQALTRRSRGWGPANVAAVMEVTGVSDPRKGGLRWSLRRGRVLVAATGNKKNHENSSSSGNSDQPIPEGDNIEGSNLPIDKSRSDGNSVHKSHQTDWRTFRANLISQYPEKLDGGSASSDAKEAAKPLGSKWAHPIPNPETGCVLVATEKLDGVRTFERTVVLLLRLGNRDPREGPFGVIINRPLDKKIKHMKPTNLDLATTFADCSVLFGGPLEASMFLLRTSEEKNPFEQVMPGVCFGARNSLDEAAGLVKRGILRPHDFRFFVGYAGWQFDQLMDEIESGYWVVAACSANVISEATEESSMGLWEEILQLMGGRYSELSRKPRQDYGV